VHYETTTSDVQAHLVGPPVYRLNAVVTHSA
jgi:hypothetical protein